LNPWAAVAAAIAAVVLLCSGVEAQDELPADSLAIVAPSSLAASDGLQLLPLLPTLPLWTSRCVIPTGTLPAAMLDGTCSVLQLLIDRCTKAGFPQPAGAFRLDDGGIALVYPPEHIKSSNGRHARPPYSLEPSKLSLFLPGELLGAMMGRSHVDTYRTVVVVMTDSPLPTTLEPASAESLAVLAQRGRIGSPSAWCRLPGAPRALEALIYQFARASRQDTLVFARQSTIAPVDHLAGAGIIK
jgi:hypothetical protein